MFFFPDVHEAFDHVLDEIEAVYHTKVDYPVAEFIICFGFFVVLILEQIVLDCKEGWQKVNKGGDDSVFLEWAAMHIPYQKGYVSNHKIIQKLKKLGYFLIFLNLWPYQCAVRG